MRRPVWLLSMDTEQFQAPPMTTGGLKAYFHAYGATASYTDVDYDEAPLDTNPGLDSEEIKFLVGVEWEATGKTTGSISEPSKFGLKATVFFRISPISSIASGRSLASVYRIAAGLSPSSEPKLPWPSTSGARSENG